MVLDMIKIYQLDRLHRFLLSWAIWRCDLYYPRNNNVNFHGMIHINPFAIGSKLLSYLHGSLFSVFSCGAKYDRIYYGEYLFVYINSGDFYMVNTSNGIKTFINGEGMENYDFYLVRGPISRSTLIPKQKAKDICSNLMLINLHFDGGSIEEQACFELRRKIIFSVLEN